MNLDLETLITATLVFVGGIIAVAIGKELRKRTTEKDDYDRKLINKWAEQQTRKKTKKKPPL